VEDSRENRLEEVFRAACGSGKAYQELEAVLSEAEEDHLGVALIQPGGSRYEQMKWQISCGPMHGK